LGIGHLLNVERTETDIRISAEAHFNQGRLIIPSGFSRGLGVHTHTGEILERLGLIVACRRLDAVPKPRIESKQLAIKMNRIPILLTSAGEKLTHLGFGCADIEKLAAGRQAANP
jgi:hypothetical protein